MQVLKGPSLACFLGLVFIGSTYGATRYVNISNGAPVAPYTSWAMAATNIQTAINAAASGDEIQVAPGVYRISASVDLPANKTNLTLRSTQSRAAIIDAQHLCRGLFISSTNSVVEGFTVRNGITLASGGGILLYFAPITVRDCLVTGNQAGSGGGGIMMQGEGSLLENSTVQSNLAVIGGGGVSFSSGEPNQVVNNCMIQGNVSSNSGGGVEFSDGQGTVSNSWVADNRAVQGDGGGLNMFGGRLVNSVIVGNNAHLYGGGVYSQNGGYMAHCTVVSNTAGQKGGGLYIISSTSWNSIVYFNTAASSQNVSVASSLIGYCCTTPNFGGGNFTNAPTFVNRVGRDFHLAAGSSCIDMGSTNSAVPRDYEGNLRPVAGTAGGQVKYDVGAYEYQAAWDAGYTDIGGGWRRLAWFGDYSVMGGDGWIWHNKHGFIYVPASSIPSDIWLYTQDMGWLWTSSTTYSFLYRAAPASWLWYNGSTNPRWFRNMTANTWESRP